jgi:hypothetical protein
MKKLLLFLFFVLSFLEGRSQTCLLNYDYIEVYTWFGNWNTPANTGFYTNAFVSSNASAAIIGSGSGTSVIESANYVLPNVVGLDPTYAHRFSFRLASYRFSNSTAATAGVDGSDYIDVRYSINNGVTYTTEMRIAGNANAFWDYNTLATAAKTANGVLTTYAPTAGGNRTTTSDGFSIIELTIPAGATQLAFSLNCRVNAAGEEWWLDNIELIQLGPCAVLPIELLSFEGTKNDDYNTLTWVTATEINNDYFTLERSVDGFNWVEITTINGSGTVSTPTFYEYKDYEFTKDTVNYYRLKQTDFNGVFEYFKMVYISNIETKKKAVLLKVLNVMGQEVNEDYRGLIIEYYSDGTTQKIYRVR